MSDDKMSDAMDKVFKAMETETQIRADALKTATRALHNIVTAQSGQGMRETAQTALNAIALALTA